MSETLQTAEQRSFRVFSVDAEVAALGYVLTALEEITDTASFDRILRYIAAWGVEHRRKIRLAELLSVSRAHAIDAHLVLTGHYARTAGTPARAFAGEVVSHHLKALTASERSYIIESQA